MNTLFSYFQQTVFLLVVENNVVFYVHEFQSTNVDGR